MKEQLSNKRTPMNQIIHDPTRGWLLLTEKWPEKTNFTYQDGFFDEVEYQIAEKNCLSTAIEIAKEDWEAILDTDKLCDQIEVNDGKYQYTKIVDHHPYSVDAEFEVKEQVWDGEKWVDRLPVHSGQPPRPFMKYRKIARLVKAKETVNYVYVPYDADCPACQYVGKDDTFKLSYTGNQTIRTCPQCGHGDVIATITTSTDEVKEEESQDELWREVEICAYVDYDLNLDFAEAKKRFRIERI